MGRRSETKPKRPLIRSAKLWVPVGIVVVIVVLGVVGVLLADRAFAAKDALERAVPLAERAQSEITAGDTAAATATAAELAEQTAVARAQTDDSLWRAVEWVPVVGPNLHAVRVASMAADELVTGAVQPATALSLDALKPKDGAIDLVALAELAEIVDGASTTVRDVAAQLDTIDRDALLGPVESGIARLDDAVSKLEPALEPAQKTLQVLPAALGADGPREYLLLFQNNAESRGTGGNPAALVLLHVEGGRISMAEQASSSDFENAREAPIVELDPETAALYGDKIGRYVQDVTLTPDFTETAEIITAFWQESFGTAVDGVISFDPVALSYVLGATGPVTVPTGETLTAENAVSLLLNEVYFRYDDPEVQDEFFAATAASIFGVITSGTGDTRALVDALGRSVDEGRLMFAPTDAAEAEFIAGTRIAGRLPADNSEQNVIGVYVNDVTESKLDYYLQMDIAAAATCPAGQPQQLSTSVSLVNTLDPGAVDGLARYISPARFFPKGEISTDLVIYGPVGSAFASATIDGAAVGATPLPHLGRPAVRVNVRNPPGTGHTIDVVFTGAPDAGPANTGPLEVWHTPMARAVGVETSGDCAG